MLRGQRLVALVVALLVVVVAAAGSIVYVRSQADQRTICAQMTDAAGLYAGNAVNIRGVRVGSVSSVSPSNGYVTVSMKVDDRPLNQDMRVVAINNSVLADRRVELVDAQARGGTALPQGSCIPLARTYTPISVSTAFQSFTKLFSDVGGPGADSQSPVRDLLAATSRELQGTAPGVNATITNLAGFMKNPDEFFAQMRGVFDNLAVLTQLTKDNLDPIRTVVTNSASLTNFMGVLFQDFTGIFIGLGQAAPAIDDIASRLIPPLLDQADRNQPSIDVTLGQIDNLRAVLEKLPGITAGLATTVNRSRSGFQVSYRSPQVRVPTPAAGAACPVLNRIRPGSCTQAPGQAPSVDLYDLVTGVVQGGIS